MRSAEEILQMKAALFADVEVPRAVPDEPISSIVAKVQSYPEHTVLVVDQRNRLVGIITDQDMIGVLADPEKAARVESGELLARDVMTPLDPDQTDSVARASTPIETVIAKMRGENTASRRFKVVPLVDNSGGVVGQVTRSSIQRGLDEILTE